MSGLNLRLTIIALLLILVLPPIGFWYYRAHRPRPTPIAPRAEINVTIIPGWNLRQVASDWVKKGIIKTPEELYGLLGKPAVNYRAEGQFAPDLNLVTASGTVLYPLLSEKSRGVSYEGFLYPDTYRVYADAKPLDVLRKIFDNLENKITPELRAEMARQKKSFLEVLTMASVVQKEAPSNEDMAMVADIFWRRYEKNWALQSCATVNYITGKNDPGVTDKDRALDSLYNTYKYPGLPLGPISNPSVSAIRAALYPKANNFWYFMAGTDGVTHYARTLEEHNRNVGKYLR
ncbi:MAG: endolytic transglycosylase MltG [Candidatus Magasanikbacteria bacterium]|jgi:UPF0755 protein